MLNPEAFEGEADYSEYSEYYGYTLGAREGLCTVQRVFLHVVVQSGVGSRVLSTRELRVIRFTA